VNERNAFLEALAQNEDDTQTRLVYADWLDEQGEHEEADRQRRWRAAKEWLVEFCRDHNPPPEEESEEWVISYEVLLDLGREAVEQADKGWFGFSCGNNMTMCDGLRANTREFWENWSVVTGIPLPAGSERRGDFSCAC
jgi:uncharacterized protein (TIGR02996 family)